MEALGVKIGMVLNVKTTTTATPRPTGLSTGLSTTTATPRQQEVHDLGGSATI